MGRSLENLVLLCLLSCFLAHPSHLYKYPICKKGRRRYSSGVYRSQKVMFLSLSKMIWYLKKHNLKTEYFLSKSIFILDEKVWKKCLLHWFVFSNGLSFFSLPQDDQNSPAIVSFWPSSTVWRSGSPSMPHSPHVQTGRLVLTLFSLSGSSHFPGKRIWTLWKRCYIYLKSKTADNKNTVCYL